MINKKIKDILIKHNIRPSIQRLIIFEYLYGNKEHPNVDVIFNAVYKKIPTLSKTTVYNTLKLFEEHNLVQSLNIEENETRYDAYVEPHIHFKCEKCNKIFDLHYNNSDIMNIKKINGNKILHKKFYFSGICKECLNASGN